MPASDADPWLAWQQALAGALAPDADRHAADVVLTLAAGDPAQAARRLARWRGGRTAHLEQVLAQAYPVLRSILGETAFARLARAYLLRHPSRDADLGRFGARLAAFVARTGLASTWPRAAPSIDPGHLAHLARLEWAVHRLHGAADCTPITAADVARLSPAELGQLRARLHPACRLHAAPCATVDWWLTRRATAAPGAPSRALIQRRGFRVEVRRLGPGEWAALAALRRGAPLARALDAAAIGWAPDREAAPDVGAMFAGWLRDGVLRELPLSAKVYTTT